MAGAGGALPGKCVPTASGAEGVKSDGIDVDCASNGATREGDVAGAAVGAAVGGVGAGAAVALLPTIMRLIPRGCACRGGGGVHLLCAIATAAELSEDHEDASITPVTEARLSLFIYSFRLRVAPLLRGAAVTCIRAHVRGARARSLLPPYTHACARLGVVVYLACIAGCDY